MQKKLWTIFLSTFFIVLVLLTIVFVFDSGSPKLVSIYEKFNVKRERDILQIKELIESYKKENNTYPIAKNFQELTKKIGYYEDDLKYYYSYNSDGVMYILTYPFESLNGVSCKVISFGFIPKEVESKVCELTVKRKVSTK